MSGWSRAFFRERVPSSRRRRGRISWWSIPVLAVTLVLIVLVADLASASTRRDWADITTANSVTPSRSVIEGSLDLHITVHGRTLEAAYTLRVPRQSLVAMDVQHAYHADGSMGDYLGAVRVGAARLTFQPPVVTVSPGSDYATVVTRTQQTGMPSTPTQVSIVPAFTDHRYLPAEVIAISTDGARLSSDRMPDASSANSETFNNVQDQLDFTVIPNGALGQAPHPKQAVAPDIAEQHFWDGEFAAGPLVPVGTALLTITVTGQQLTCSYRLSFPTDDAAAAGTLTLRAALHDGYFNGDSHWLAALVGEVKVAGRRLKFSDPVTLPVTDDSIVAVRIDSTSTPLREQTPQVNVVPAQRPGLMPPLDVTILTNGAEVLAPDRTATTMTATRATFQHTEGITFAVRVPGFNPKAVPKQQSNAALHEWEQAYVPGFSTAAYWVCLAAPVAYFLWLWRRRYIVGIDGRSRRISAIVLWCFLATAVSTGVAALVFRWSLATPIVDFLARTSSWHGGRADAHSTTAEFLLLLGPGVLWLTFAWKQRLATALAVPARAETGWLRSLGGDIMAAVLVAVATLAISGAAGVAGVGVLSNVLVFGLSGLVIAGLLWVLVTALRLPVPRIVRILSVALILTWSVLGALIASAVGSWLEYAIVIGVSAALIVTTALLGLAAAPLYLTDPPAFPRATSWFRSLSSLDQPATPLRRLIAEHRGLSAAITAAALLLAVPSWTLDPQSNFAGGWTIADLMNWLATLLLIIFASVLVAILRRDHDYGTELIGDHRARTLGAIMASSILFDPFNQILYVPLPLIVGYLLFTRFLLLSPKNSFARQLRHIRGRRRSYLVDNAVAAGVRLRSDTASSSSKSPDRAESTTPGTAAEPRTGNASLRSWRRTRAAEEARRLGLALGTSDSAWIRAGHLALFSLLISLPWEVLYFILHGLGVQLAGTSYVALGAVTMIAFSSVQWPALGFVIGFFYPALRGTSGLWKGLSMAITYILPFAVFDIVTALIGNSVSWGPELLWATQVFITCVGTGFYAELRTLTDAGHSWKDVSALHNFRGLAAWGSSVVAAVTTAVITVAVSPLSQAVTSEFGGSNKPPSVSQPSQSP